MNPRTVPVIRLTSPEEAWWSRYQQIMRDEGILLLQTAWEDPAARFMQAAVAMLGTVNPHDSSRTAIWDVRCDPSSPERTGARSHSLDAFPLHTDCSFEDPAPRGMALYVVREDRLGGGRTCVVDGRQVLGRLTAEVREILGRTSFRFMVPAEFAKDRPWIEAPILDAEGNFRYRREIIDHTRLSEEQEGALEALGRVLEDPALVLPLPMGRGMLLLLDNGRHLHCRTAIHDPERHLKRIRFHLHPGPRRPGAIRPVTSRPEARSC